MQIFSAVGEALWLSFTMFWQIFWGLSLGFVFSAIIEVIVSKDTMSSLLPDGSARSIAKAGLFGAATSSCSYAAVAMARSVVRKGGNFTAAMAFQFAATNLVLELGILLWVLMAWQFAAAEFVGGTIMLVLLGAGYAWFLPQKIEEEAVEHAKGDAKGSMEGHAEMAMGKQEGSWTQRLASGKGWVAISHSYVMNWAMVWKDVLVGLLVAGALGAWVPDHFWQSFFLQGHNPWVVALWGAAIGPLIAVAAFTCSIGNVPLAAVLWNGGISFGGVVAFIFGDLIIPPILNIYRKYYGGKPTLFLFVSFYLIMVVAALCVEGLFVLFGWVPANQQHVVQAAKISLDYTAVLNILFGAVAAVLVVMFLRS
ncbi:MAG: permease, partial [Pseudomonadota bacterium]|nr:permease [Pseudomonadota bacterium]